MLKGAIFGDIAGSKYEFQNIKTKDFPLISHGCTFTDDTVMTIAVANALIKSHKEKSEFKANLISEMQAMGKKYPNAGYGGMFYWWLNAADPKPYNSFGNGSAMRVSPCGLVAVELEEALVLARASAEVTHNHPEGIKGAQAVAGAIFLAKCHKSKEEIAEFIKSNFYDLDKNIDEIRTDYEFDVTCQGSVPQAIQAFLESDSYEDAIRNAVSIGGDSDTIAAVTGSVAWAYYKNSADYEEANNKLSAVMQDMLPEEFLDTIKSFDMLRIAREGTYDRTGFCSKIPVNRKVLNPYKLKLADTPICLEHIPLREKLSKISPYNITKRICSGEGITQILSDTGLGIYNYNQFDYLIDIITKKPDYLYSASLEECLIYSTFLWRADYSLGGNPAFWRDHIDEVRTVRMRIVELLTDY